MSKTSEMTKADIAHQLRELTKNVHRYQLRYQLDQYKAKVEQLTKAYFSAKH